jgi:hypothetical protein
MAAGRMSCSRRRGVPGPLAFGTPRTRTGRLRARPRCDCAGIRSLDSGGLFAGGTSRSCVSAHSGDTREPGHRRRGSPPPDSHGRRLLEGARRRAQAGRVRRRRRRCRSIHEAAGAKVCCGSSEPPIVSYGHLVWRTLALSESFPTRGPARETGRAGRSGAGKFSRSWASFDQ